ncbi:DNA polymerase III subunit alpha [Agrilactobacillus fermenti]|uniref:DNA polymerase III subunit alpha n=1 Tax=Agrilactobacillus fermenti TaxID=2586909 RepID=UPI003A5BA863
MAFTPNFTQLQVKSSFSLLQSPIKIPELVQRAYEMGYQALAITDVNVVYGLIDFYKACQQQHIRPILGLTAYLGGVSAQYDDQRYPYLFYAKNNQGYQHLLEISTRIMMHPDQSVSITELQDVLSDLFVVLPPRSELEYLIADGNNQQAVAYLNHLKSLLDPSDLLIGLTLQGNFSRELSKTQIIAHQNQIQTCALGKVDYLTADQAFDTKVLQYIDAGSKLNLKTELQDSEGPFYLLTPAAAQQPFEQQNDQEAIRNNLRIANECQVELDLGQRTQLPKFPTPNQESAKSYLYQLVQQGWQSRFASKTMNPTYQKRIDYELQVINKMGFADYFLIVWDVINYAHQANIMTGAGRGSAAGSLVAYLLGITDVDPIQYNLLFERFLNPNRANMPDIDLDIPDNRRDELLDYVYQRYGADHVSQIITFGTLAAKMALRDVGRVFGISQAEANQWSKAIPGVLKITLTQAYEQSPSLQQIVHQNHINERIFKTAQQLEGLPRHYSTHAAGVVLSDEPLTQRVALQIGGDEIPLTQYPMGDVEAVGLLKMDFLGLKNLNILAQVTDAVHRESDPDFSPHKIPLDDVKTLALFQRGDTNGVFQFESDGIKRVLRQLQPDSFEDIVATNALYRPGPMENIDIFIARKNGQEPVVYADEALEPILKPTYGVLVYQEQVMQVASVMGGFTLGEADLLRRAMSKKKKVVIDENRTKFIDGAVAKGFSVTSARMVYEYIERFANYGFNRSHAVAYSKLAFWLAYVKVHFPASFFTALLNTSIGNDVKTKTYFREAKQRQIKILGPDINQSNFDFTEKEGQIRFGFISIKGVRRDLIQAILTTRANEGLFQSLEDFLKRLPSKFLKVDTIKPLIEVGAFDTLRSNRKQLQMNLPKLIDSITLAGDSMSLFEILTPEMAYVDDYAKAEKAQLEADLLGTYISGHPLERFKSLTHEPILNLAPDKTGRVLYYVRKVKVIRTKKGAQMAFLSGEDLTQTFSVTVFPNIYKQVQTWLQKDQNVMIDGKFEWDKDHAPQLIANHMTLAEQVAKVSTPTAATTEPSDQKQQVERSLKQQQKLYLQIPTVLDTSELRQEVYQTLQKSHGTTPVVIFLRKDQRKLLLKETHWITWTEGLRQTLEKLLGKENVVFK